MIWTVIVPALNIAMSVLALLRFAGVTREIIADFKAGVYREPGVLKENVWHRDTDGSTYWTTFVSRAVGVAIIWTLVVAVLGASLWQLAMGAVSTVSGLI